MKSPASFDLLSLLQASNRFAAEQFPTFLVPLADRETRMGPCLDELFDCAFLGSKPALTRHALAVAGNGLFLCFENPWLQAVVELTESKSKLAEHFVIPAGFLIQKVSLRCGAIPRSAIQSILDLFANTPSVEQAGFVIWNSQANTFRAQAAAPVSQSGSHIQYAHPALAPCEWVIMDLHSHGSFDAFFSNQDDQDDKGTTQVSMVIGSLSSPGCEPVSWCVRLNCLGVYVPLVAKGVAENPAAVLDCEDWPLPLGR